MDRKSSYTYEDLILGTRGELMEPDTPRLPTPNMLMFDRVVDVHETGDRGGGEVTAELDIRPDLWFFGCHFIGDPVMPGCLGLDAMWQLLGFYLGWSGHTGYGRALGVKEVKFRGQVLPNAKCVTYRVDISRILSSKLVLGIANAVMSVDGREIYWAEVLGHVDDAAHADAEMRAPVDQLVSAIRHRVSAALEDADDDTESAVTSLRNIYREIKIQRVGSCADSVCRMAAGRSADRS